MVRCYASTTSPLTKAGSYTPLPQLAPADVPEGAPDSVGVPGAATPTKGQGNKKPSVREFVIECLCPCKGVEKCGVACV